MKKILMGIFFCTCTGLFASDVVEGYGAAAAFIINQKMNVTAMNDSEKMQACKNTIKASGEDRSRPFLENYDQAMNIAVNACLKELK